MVLTIELFLPNEIIEDSKAFNNAARETITSYEDYIERNVSIDELTVVDDGSIDSQWNKTLRRILSTSDKKYMPECVYILTPYFEKVIAKCDALLEILILTNKLNIPTYISHYDIVKDGDKSIGVLIQWHEINYTAGIRLDPKI